MLRSLTLLTAFPVLFLGGAVHAQTPTACAERNMIVKRLDAGYSEKPVSMGLSVNGSVVEVFASTSGSFTIIATQPDGVSCILVTGQSWEDVPLSKAGQKT